MFKPLHMSCGSILPWFINSPSHGVTKQCASDMGLAWRVPHRCEQHQSACPSVFPPLRNVTAKDNVNVLSRLTTWVTASARVRVTEWERTYCKYLIVISAQLSGTTCTENVDSFLPKILQINQCRLSLLLVIVPLEIHVPWGLRWAVLRGRNIREEQVKPKRRVFK